MQLIRTFGAALVGGTVGAFATGALVGYVVFDGQGLATLGAVIVAAALGALGGVSVAVAIALRDRPMRVRGVTILTVLVVGPPLCALVAWGLARTAFFGELDTRHLFLVWLGAVLPTTALLGTWLASRRRST